MATETRPVGCKWECDMTSNDENCSILCQSPNKTWLEGMLPGKFSNLDHLKSPKTRSFLSILRKVEPKHWSKSTDKVSDLQTISNRDTPTVSAYEILQQLHARMPRPQRLLTFYEIETGSASILNYVKA